MLAKRPPFILDWDPIDYQWTNPYPSNKFNFFQYFVQLGRRLVASQYWNQQGITPQFLAKFWAILWARKQHHKILHVQWLVVHRACTRFQLQTDTQKHCLWECIESQ